MATQMSALRTLRQQGAGLKVAVAAATIGVIYGYDLGNISGALVVMYQVATVSGIVVAYFVDYALAGSGAWRVMLALSAVPSLLVLFLLLRLPDTPRWYVMKGRREDARDALQRTDPDADT